MPLRSVEAATRDDAIAAAREQFGPTARIVGVRRVRSGGVLGFFATERYVAEVDPDHPLRAAGRSPSVEAPVADARPSAPSGGTPSSVAADRVSELAGLLGHHSPAGDAELPTYSRATVARPSAAREFLAPEPARAEAPFDWSRFASDRPAAEPFQPARVDVGSLRIRAGVATPAPAPWSVAASALEGPDLDLPDPDDEPDDAPGIGESLPPSPFTAALARMVSGDRDVRQAVQAALEDRDAPGDGAAEPFGRDDAEPLRPRSTSSAATPASTGAGHQEEEPVVEQDDVTPSVRTEVRPAEFPTWAESEPAPEPVSRREEAIAEVLRVALAQGHSDETLTGILRKVLDGVSPQAALTAETAAVTAPAVELPAPAVETAPTFEPPAAETPLFDEPVFDEPVFATPLFDVTPEVPAAEPTWLGADQPLWGEPVLAPRTETPRTETPRTETPQPEASPVVESPVVESPVLETPTAEAPVAEAPVAEAPAAPAPAAEPALPAFPVVEDLLADEHVAEESAREIAVAPATATLARTASDPAPLPLDATAVMPPLSLLPPLPSSGRRSGGLPPVPPARSLLSPSRPAASARAASEAVSEPRTEAAPTPALAPARTLATVTRLPVAPLEEAPEPAEVEPALPEAPAAAPATQAAPAPGADLAETVAVRTPEVAPPAPASPWVGAAPAPRPDLLVRLRALGIPDWLLGPSFAADAAAHGAYAALTRALGSGLPAAPEVPAGAGEALFVVGPGVETLRAARSLAASLRLDPDRVQWATRGDLAGLAPEYSRMTTIEAAIERRQAAGTAGTVTIVAVDAPLRTDAYWMSQMLAIWGPAAVWAVVDATRKPEDVEPWIDGLPRVDALMVEDTDLSADPAAVLHRIAMPVALLDGVPATPHRWASLLCERLDKQQG